MQTYSEIVSMCSRPGPKSIIRRVQAIAEFRETLASMGARVMEMSPEEHDHTMAFTSHLPQLLSTALAATLAQDGDTTLSQVFGTGLLDMTRLALSSHELWNSILSTNKTQVSDAIDA